MERWTLKYVSHSICGYLLDRSMCRIRRDEFSVKLLRVPSIFLFVSPNLSITSSVESPSPFPPLSLTVEHNGNVFPQVSTYNSSHQMSTNSFISDLLDYFHEIMLVFTLLISCRYSPPPLASSTTHPIKTKSTPENIDSFQEVQYCLRVLRTFVCNPVSCINHFFVVLNIHSFRRLLV